MSRLILVTGPQRSGTTIAAATLADDFNLTFIDETGFIPGNSYEDAVIQSPNALDSYVILHHMYPDAEFVFVRRDKADIIASMKRIEWLKDDVQDWESFLNDYVDNRFELWDKLKAYLPNQTQEIPYNALKGHRFFVNKEQRKHFTTKQWQVGKPIGPKVWPNNQQGIQELYRERYSISTEG